MDFILAGSEIINIGFGIFSIVTILVLLNKYPIFILGMKFCFQLSIILTSVFIVTYIFHLTGLIDSTLILRPFVGPAIALPGAIALSQLLWIRYKRKLKDGAN